MYGHLECLTRHDRIKWKYLRTFSIDVDSREQVRPKEGTLKWKRKSVNPRRA